MEERLPLIMPLFWQHGESFPVLEAEIRQMYRWGLRGFIVESRPFPDYMGPKWRETLHFILDLADQLEMSVLLFDDSHFPSGYGDGRIAAEHPEQLRLLVEMRTEIISAGGEYVFRPDSFLQEGDKFVHSAALLELEDQRTIKSLEPVPADRESRLVCRETRTLAVWVVTRNGGEEHTHNYISMISPAAVRCYLETIYAPHVAELRRHRSFQGFFSDEPRIANAATYDAVLGRFPMSLPYDAALDYGRLPYLFFDSAVPGVAETARMEFMDQVSAAYSRAFPQQIGEFCREHGLAYIGHIVEDNGAHCRLGYGDGHYFRSQQGQTWAGVDTVLGQNVAGCTSGLRPSVFGPYRDDFFHWALMKLAGSCGDLRGIPAFCEIFGAYGWSENVTRMLWHTHLALVQGINRLVPHAFSPKAFPDPDCPPHFYAGGRNPQGRFFPIWREYAEFWCGRLSRGRHPAPVGVLYPAETEWYRGEALSLGRILAACSARQLETVIIPLDELASAVMRGQLQVLLVGDWEKLPAVLREKIRKAAGNLPVRGLDDAGLAEEIAAVAAAFPPALRIDGIVPNLRTYHRESAAGHDFLLVNDNMRLPLAAQAEAPAGCRYLCDVLHRTYRFFSGGLFTLLPNQALLLTTDLPAGFAPELEGNYRPVRELLPADWRFAAAAIEEYPQFRPVPAVDPHFGGVIRGEVTLTLPAGRYRLTLPRAREGGVEFLVNGRSTGTAVTPPYRTEFTLEQDGNCRLTADLFTTLGWQYPSKFEEPWPPFAADTAVYFRGLLEASPAPSAEADGE